MRTVRVDEEAVQVEIEKMLVLDFKLPGVRASSRGGRTGVDPQLDSRMDERWTLRVNAENAMATIRQFRAIATELEKHLGAFGLAAP